MIITGFFSLKIMNRKRIEEKKRTLPSKRSKKFEFILLRIIFSIKRKIESSQDEVKIDIKMPQRIYVLPVKPIIYERAFSV